MVHFVRKLLLLLCLTLAGTAHEMRGAWLWGSWGDSGIDENALAEFTDVMKQGLLEKGDLIGLECATALQLKTETDTKAQEAQHASDLWAQKAAIYEQALKSMRESAGHARKAQDLPLAQAAPLSEGEKVWLNANTRGMESGFDDRILALQKMAQIKSAKAKKTAQFLTERQTAYKTAVATHKAISEAKTAFEKAKTCDAELTKAKESFSAKEAYIKETAARAGVDPSNASAKDKQELDTLSQAAVKSEKLAKVAWVKAQKQYQAATEALRKVGIVDGVLVPRPDEPKIDISAELARQEEAAEEAALAEREIAEQAARAEREQVAQERAWQLSQEAREQAAQEVLDARAEREQATRDAQEARATLAAQEQAIREAQAIRERAERAIQSARDSQSLAEQSATAAQAAQDALEARAQTAEKALAKLKKIMDAPFFDDKFRATKTEFATALVRLLAITWNQRWKNKFGADSKQALISGLITDIARLLNDGASLYNEAIMLRKGHTEGDLLKYKQYAAHDLVTVLPIIYDLIDACIKTRKLWGKDYPYKIKKQTQKKPEQDTASEQTTLNPIDTTADKNPNLDTQEQDANEIDALPTVNTTEKTKNMIPFVEGVFAIARSGAKCINFEKNPKLKDSLIQLCSAFLIITRAMEICIDLKGKKRAYAMALPTIALAIGTTIYDLIKINKHTA